ncbi:MAG: DUF1566 domain-containing protein [Achromobacter sp.]|uniref:Lcl C-terminal domain-containing protein n=1 Tax=unclassified Achromobacter TaxID=2626865 RepID=UPI0006C72CC7|nr:MULTISPECIES: DUF1566 domain-containing protein [unclassified Achromobacter]MBN9640393.1 DUF1566 domain-containing protein [Achromobacter sp.]CUJ58523.1 Uncharacterised protein [Achromobacter sp. 2789STDY5608633]
MNNMIPLDPGGLRLEIPASTLLGALSSYLASRPGQPVHQAKIGQYLPGQGGIYAGDILGDDGVVYGLVVASEDLDGTYTWGPDDGERTASTWDGLVNTNDLLRHDSAHPAARAARAYSADGHADFYLPAKRELQIIAANLPHLFQPKPYWTSTPHGSYTAWAVNFESGGVTSWLRGNAFRVRPVRRFTY